MKKELTKEEIYFLARQTSVDPKTLMSIKTLLDVHKVRRLLIEFEYKERIKDRRIMRKDVIQSLAEKYDMSRSSIEIIIYVKKPNRGKPCVRCGQYITSFRWNRNNGICNNCMETEKSKTDD